MIPLLIAAVTRDLSATAPHKLCDRNRRCAKGGAYLDTKTMSLLRKDLNIECFGSVVEVMTKGLSFLGK